MAKPTPEELEEMVKKQSEIYGDQDPTEEPVDVDEAARNAWGNELDDDEELNIAQEIEEDEDDRTDAPDNSEDPPESEL